jgi:hypothetical protein
MSWRSIWWPSVIVLTFGVATDSDAQQKARFLLVPEERWSTLDAAAPQRAAVSEGSVLLYTEGSYEPSHVLPANQEVTIPPGQWLWFAEAPGYVSVSPGAIGVPGGRPADGPVRNLVWPLAPACQVRVDPSLSWPPVERVDVVSLTRGTVHPITPKRVLVSVPAGPFLSYGVAGGRLYAISRPDRCRHREEKAVPLPAPPGPESQQFLKRIMVPGPRTEPTGDAPLDVPQTGAGWSETERAELVAMLRWGGKVDGAAASPVAVVWDAEGANLFFVGVPATPANLELSIRHPSLQTHLEPLPSLGGSVRELEVSRLRPRLALPLEIDYRPRRPHATAEVVAFFCGHEPLSGGYLSLESCSLLDQRLPLHDGSQEVTLRSLDWGQYIVAARIDQELLLGLGAGFMPFLDPGEASPPEQPFRVWEMHVFGNILVDGDPVGGKVRLDPSRGYALSGALGEVLVFETGPDLLFHLYYLGREPRASSLTAEEREDGRSHKSLPLGLDRAYSLSVCLESGFCKVLSSHTRLRGEGRLDLELASDRRLTVEVTDADEGTPVAGMQVLINGPSQALVFEDGELEWGKPGGAEGVALASDEDGKARFLDPNPEEQMVRVRGPGYRPGRTEVEVGAAGESHVSVELEREASRAGAWFELRHEDGSPVPGAYLVAMGADGERRHRCSSRTDHLGRIALGAGCSGVERLVVLHSGSRIIGFDNPLTNQAGVVERVERPLRLRLVDRDGWPIPAAAVELEYRDFTVGPNDFLSAIAAGASVPFYTTNERGELTLRGIDPDAVEVPTIHVGAGGLRASTSLSGFVAGEVVVLEAKPE